MVARAEEPAGYRAAPQEAVLFGASGFERKDINQGVGNILAPAVTVDGALGLRRIGRRGDFRPAAVFAAVQLGAEMSVVERGVSVSAAPVVESERDVVAEKVDAGDAPVAFGAFGLKQPFAS